MEVVAKRRINRISHHLANIFMGFVFVPFHIDSFDHRINWTQYDTTFQPRHIVHSSDSNGNSNSAFLKKILNLFFLLNFKKTQSYQCKFWSKSKFQVLFCLFIFANFFFLINWSDFFFVHQKFWIDLVLGIICANFFFISLNKILYFGINLQWNISTSWRKRVFWWFFRCLKLKAYETASCVGPSEKAYRVYIWPKRYKFMWLLL